MSQILMNNKELKILSSNNSSRLSQLQNDLNNQIKKENGLKLEIECLNEQMNRIISDSRDKEERLDEANVKLSIEIDTTSKLKHEINSANMELQELRNQIEILENNKEKLNSKMHESELKNSK